MLGIFKRKAAKSATATEATSGKLLVHLGTGGYSARNASDPATNLTTGDTLLVDTEGPERLEQTIQETLNSVSKKDLKHTKHIIVLLGGADCAYLDSRESTLSAATNERVREFGTRLLGAPKVSFGRMDFGQTQNQRRNPGGIYAFIDAVNLQRYLAAFGEHCTRVSAIIPEHAVLLQRAQKIHDKAYGAIHFGSTTTTVVLANWKYQSVIVRHIPIGLKSLLEAVANHANLSVNDVLKGLSTRDHISALSDHNADTPAMGPIADGLKPTLSSLASEIRGTIDFFEEQRVSGRPESFELLGEFNRIEGFPKWLGSACDIELDVLEDSLFDLLCREAGENPLNIMTGLEGSPISVGKMRYSYVDSQLIPTRQISKTVSPEKTARTTSRRGRKRRGSKDSGTSFLSTLFKKNTDKDKDKDGNMAATDEDQDPRVYWAGFAFIILAVAYLAYGKYETMEKRHIAFVNNYQKSLNENISLRNELEKLNIPQKAIVKSEIDKVLWTEKFLAVGEHMSDYLWLTDVYLSEEQRTFNNVTGLTKKLVIEGSALPSTNGHIDRIASYIEALEDDQQYDFMRDFSEITFEGAHVDESEPSGVVRFTLAAWYDELKRTDSKGKSIEKGDGDNGKKPGGLAEMNQNINSRNATLQKTLGK